MHYYDFYFNWKTRQENEFADVLLSFSIQSIIYSVLKHMSSVNVNKR